MDTEKTIKDEAAKLADGAIETGRDAAGAVKQASRKAVVGARVRGRRLEDGARKVVVKAAERIEEVSRKLKEDQKSKRKTAQGKLGAATKAQYAIERESADS